MFLGYEATGPTCLPRSRVLIHLEGLVFLKANSEVNNYQYINSAIILWSIPQYFGALVEDRVPI